MGNGGLLGHDGNRFMKLLYGKSLALLFFTLLCACAHLPTLVFNQNDRLTASEYTQLGNAYLANGQRDLAIRQYESALKDDKRYVPALAASGNFAYEAHDFKKARAFYKRLLKIDPKNVGALNNLALVEMHTGHLSRAKKLADRALPTAGPLAPYVMDTLAQIEKRRAAAP